MLELCELITKQRINKIVEKSSERKTNTAWQKKDDIPSKIWKLLRLNSYVWQRQNRTHFFSSNFSYHKIISWIWHRKMHLIQTSIVEVIRRAPLSSCLISCLFFQAKVSILPHMNARSAASTTFHNQGWPGMVNFHSLQGLNTKTKVLDYMYVKQTFSMDSGTIIAIHLTTGFSKQWNDNRLVFKGNSAPCMHAFTTVTALFCSSTKLYTCNKLFKFNFNFSLSLWSKHLAHGCL